MECREVSELGEGSDLGRRLEALSGSPNLKSVSKGEGQSGESGKQQKMFCIDDLVWNRQSRDPDQLVWRPPAEIGQGTRLEIGPRVPAVSFQKAMALSTPVNSAFSAHTTRSNVITRTFQAQAADPAGTLFLSARSCSLFSRTFSFVPTGVL